MDDKRSSKEVWLSAPSEFTYWDAPERQHGRFTGRAPKTMHWSIPWSDLMMTMFILFVILYICSTSKDEILPQSGRKSMVGTHMAPDTDMAIGERGPYQATVKDSISNIYDLGRETVRTNNLEDFASVDLVPNKAVRIVLASDLLFDTGKADLRPEAKDSLKRIAGIVRQTPYMVNVVGHTDDVPIHSGKFPSNWELSAIRACQVARFLMEETGLPERKFFISGHAHHQPVFANTSDKNRAANRRVEIIITKEKPDTKTGISENTLALALPGGDHRSPRQLWPWNTF